MTRWLLAVALVAAGQVAQQANEPYRTEQGRRQIADGILVSPDRDRTQKPAELVAALGIKPGMTVADVGTGPGYLLPYLSRAVGPQGRVFGQDLFPDFLERARKSTAGLGNIEFVRGAEREARLPAGAFDLVLMLDVYHHLDYPGPMLASLRRALKPDGRLAVVDYHKRGGWSYHVRGDQAEFIREIEAAGFRLADKRDFLPGVQYILTFTAEKN